MLKVDITNPIAVGRTAEIFALDEQYVLKLFLSHFPDDEAENEAARIRVVMARLPVPTTGHLGPSVTRRDGGSAAPVRRRTAARRRCRA